MSLGAVGAYGAAGGNAALKALRDELLKRAMLEQQQKQQTFQNDLALRGANRADAQLSAQQENNSLIRQGQAEARAETERKNKEAAAKDRYNQAAGLRESLPPETPLGLDNPALAQMAQDAPGLMGTLRMAQAPSMGPDFQGPMPGDQFGPETPQQAQTGGLRGYLTMATQKQAEKAADDTRQADQAKQNAKYQDALIAKMSQPSQGGNDGAGWQLKEVTDPTTNKTSLVRVNSRTGEVQPVTLPDGAQPGGSRQKSLSVAQQEELATMQTVEDMANEVKALGDSIGWKGVGGMGTGSVNQFLAKNAGMGTSKEEMLRNKIGNIQGTIAKLRGGTSFTPNEQALLETYVPTINDSDAVNQAKLQSLVEFIRSKRANTMKYAGGGEVQAPPAPAPSSGFRVVGVR